MRIVLMVLAWSTGLSVQADELSLLQAYDSYRSGDAEYQVAGYAYRATQEEEAIGRAPLLPSVDISSRYGEGERLGGGSGAVLEDQNFQADSHALIVQQPLYDKARWAGYEQAKARGKLGSTEFGSAGQKLFPRVVDAYFEVARADNELRLARQQMLAIEALAEQSRRLFEAGEGTVTDREEAQARLDLVRAEVIEQVARRHLALNRLEERVGSVVTQVATVQEHLPPPDLLPSGTDLAYWLDWAKKSSPLLESRRISVAVAQAGLEKQRAGHYPRLNLTGQLAQSDPGSLNDQAQRQSTYYVGVQLTVPIYEGGGVSASIRQAEALQTEAEAEYDAAFQQLAEEIEADYLGVVSGLAKSEALLAAVRSNQRALESAQKGYLAGVRSTVEILDAQQRLFAARRDLLNSKLLVLQSYVGLHSRCGSMTRTRLQQVQALF